MRIWHYFEIVCYVVIGLGLFVSCNEEEEVGKGDETSQEGKDPLVPTPEGERFMKAQQIIKNLCEVDSVNGSATYDFKIGEVLDVTRPTEFSVGMDDLEEATEFFRSSILGTTNEPVDLNGVLEVDLQEQGSLVFAPGGDNGALATLTINLVDLPVMTKLYFIPATLWPDNASSPYAKGNILYDKIDKRYYVCIASYDTGRDGVLFTLDGGWSYDSNDDKDEMATDGGKVVNYYNVPSEADFNSLYDYYTTKHDDLLARLLLAFPDYTEAGCFHNRKSTEKTSTRPHKIDEAYKDVLSGSDWRRDDFDNKMREEGFHMTTTVKEYWAWFEYWHEYWFYGYRLKNAGGQFGEKYQLQYIDTQKYNVPGVYLLLCSMRHFSYGAFDNNRYELKRR